MFLYGKLFPTTYPITVTFYRVTLIGAIFTILTTFKSVLITVFLYGKLLPTTHPVAIAYNPITLIGAIFSTSPPFQ